MNSKKDRITDFWVGLKPWTFLRNSALSVSLLGMVKLEMTLVGIRSAFLYETTAAII